DPRFEVVSSEVPTTLPVGQEIHIRVVVRNIGSEPWDPATRDHLSYHLDDPASGETLIWDGRRSELPRRVEPGEEVTLDAIVWLDPKAIADFTAEHTPRPGARPRRYEFSWAMVREQVRWYSHPLSGEGPDYPVALVDARPEWTQLGLELEAQPNLQGGTPGAESLDPAVPPLWDGGSEVRVRATLRNDGWTAWRPERGDRVAMRWFLPDGRPLRLEGRRSELPRVVEVGESVELTMVGEVPEGEGEVELRIEPLREAVRWYGTGSQAAALRLRVRRHPLQWQVVAMERPESLPADAVVHLKV